MRRNLSFSNAAFSLQSAQRQHSSVFFLVMLGASLAFMLPSSSAAQMEAAFGPARRTLALKANGSATGESQCLTTPIVLELGDSGSSVPNPPNAATPLLSAVNIVNTGTAEVQNLEITAITLPGGTLTSPVSLPLSLGAIQSEGTAVLDADFSGGPFNPSGNPYPLTVTGTYTVNAVSYCFTLTTDLVVPPAAPGSAATKTVQFPSHFVSGGGFPTGPPDFDPDTNAGSAPVPIAPFVPLLTLSPPTTAIQAGNSVRAAGVYPPAVVFNANNSMGMLTAGANCDKPNLHKGECAEPSGDVTGAGFVFATANWEAAFSPNGNPPFTIVDSRTVFPQDGYKLCCDQIVIYSAKINRFIWLIQNLNATTSAQGGYRLAMAKPSDILSSNGTAWTYWNLTWNSFWGGCNNFDYPSMSLGDDNLYMSWNARCPTIKGRLVARTSLASIQAGGIIDVGYTDPALATMASGGNVTQTTGKEGFWAGHKNNSHMRVFYWPDTSNTFSWSDVAISTWSANKPKSKTPDGIDWLAKNFGQVDIPGPLNNVIGATRNGNNLWFAWIAGTDSNFPMAHVEMVQLLRSVNKSGVEAFGLVQQVQIWNNVNAFAYPSLATNACTKEIGVSLEYGGGGSYENHVVGIFGDSDFYVTTASNKGDDHFGDYVTIRQAASNKTNPGNLFAAFGFGVIKDLSSKTGSDADVHYVLFGRPASSCSR
jgi:hypothetical protein